MVESNGTLLIFYSLRISRFLSVKSLAISGWLTLYRLAPLGSSFLIMFQGRLWFVFAIVFEPPSRLVLKVPTCAASLPLWDMPRGSPLHYFLSTVFHSGFSNFNRSKDSRRLTLARSATASWMRLCSQWSVILSGKCFSFEWILGRKLVPSPLIIFLTS